MAGDGGQEGRQCAQAVHFHHICQGGERRLWHRTSGAKGEYEQGTFHQFSANSDEELESWLRVIGKAIVRASTTEWDETSDRLEESQQ
eukprot:752050-Hanusia_phi.AAC.2